MTSIELTDKDALLFVEFQKYYILFGMLKSIGALDIKNGSVTFNFDYLGNIKSVNKIENFNQ